jgi:hypothetical protein
MNLASWPGEIIKAAGAFGTFQVAAGAARTVVAALRAELDRIIERSKAAQTKGVTFAQALESVYRINPADSNISSLEIEEMILNRSGGADKAMVASMMEAGISASSTLDKRSVATMVTDIARMLPGQLRSNDVEGTKAVVEGVLTAIQRGGDSYTGDITQKTEQALGTMFGAGAAARITNMPKIATNIMGGAAKLGLNYEEAAEFISAITSTAEEREGDISQTFGVNVMGQLREQFLKVGRLDLAKSDSFTQMREFFNSDAPGAAEIRGHMIGYLRGKTQEEIDELIKSGEMAGMTDAQISGSVKSRAKTDVVAEEIFTPGGQTTFDERWRVAQSQIATGEQAQAFFRGQMEAMAKSPVLKQLHEEAVRQQTQDRMDYQPLRMAAGSRQKDIEIALSETDPLTSGALGSAYAMVDKAIIGGVAKYRIGMAGTEEQQAAITSEAAGNLSAVNRGLPGSTLGGMVRIGALPVTWPLEVLEAIGRSIDGQSETQKMQLDVLRNIQTTTAENNASKIIAPRPAPAPAPPTPAPLP